MNEKLLAALKEKADELRKKYKPEHMFSINDMLDRAIDIVSRHTPAAVPSESESGLREELVAKLKSVHPSTHTTWEQVVDELWPMLMAHPTPSTTEPLAGKSEKLLMEAYSAMSRMGWEKGPTIEEVRDSINCHLDNLCGKPWVETKEARAYLTALPDKGVE